MRAFFGGTMNKRETGICQITKKTYPLDSLVHADSIRGQIKEMMKADIGGWDDSGYVSIYELNAYRNKYLSSIIAEESGEIEKLDKEVLESIEKAEPLTVNVNDELEEELSMGQRLADRMADFVGSWPFIVIFGVFLSVWISINVFVLLAKPFDPYPFILLNLILSCIAAIQAPLIMMSQNRQEMKDRIRSQNDYKVNLKAELEIRQLHEKIDHILLSQGKRLFDIQQIQIEMMEQILDREKNISPK